ncbi:SseB family protein [Streptomyces sp. HC44]|uniref:SseB family protein n=1 Tax=Streptomyces scabichelini TaxID=2711217 RepID=A0A6G4V4U0_9ACTN|nr:SseB family protein [Streptomyces scabichelini]NGO08887.1 SseB family protein [Streptomyces scabichelini]
MTDSPSDSAASAVRQALRAVVENGADDAALRMLAGSEVLIPADIEAAGPDPRSLSLPVYELGDGTELVPVFTTQARMQQAIPQTGRHRSVVLGALARGWPSEKLSLVIDAGTPEELALTARGVRELLDRDDS